MKGFLITNTANKKISIKLNNKLIEIKAKEQYFFESSLLTGELKLLERKEIISIKFVENIIVNNIVKNNIVEEEIISKKKTRNKKNLE